jgi:hypothetical protein
MRAANALASAKELQDLLNQEVYRLRYAWNTFKQLFASSEDNIRVLNAVGPIFFGVAERLMWDDIILRVCRLTDPARGKSQKNVTLAQVLAGTGWEANDSARWTKYSDRLRDVTKACATCRKHRNKRISHCDVRWAKKTLTLPGAGVKTLDAAVDEIERFAGDMYGELNVDASISFEIVNDDWAVKHLLRRLTNRRAQRQPDAVVTIRYQPAAAAVAELECPFCRSVETVSFYPQRDPISWQRVRWHFDKCDGVIGCETLNVRAIDTTGISAPIPGRLDLTIPTNKTF